MSCVLGSAYDWEVVHESVSLDVEVEHRRLAGTAVLAMLPHGVSPPTTSTTSTTNTTAKDSKVIIKASMDRRLSIVSTPNSIVSTPPPSGPEASKRKIRSIFPSQHRRIYLNCSSQIKVAEVRVEDVVTTFELRDPFRYGQKSPDPHQYPECRYLAMPPSLERARSLACFDAALNCQLDWANQGQLCIAVPDSIKITKRLRPLLDEEKIDAAAAAADQSAINELLAPLLITIRYEIVDPDTGFQFSLPNQHFPRRVPHCFSFSNLGGCASWFPCRDSAWERCTFDINITVPSGYVTVASGSLVGSEFANATQTKRTDMFRVLDPVLSSSIAVVVGEFEVIQDAAMSSPKVQHIVPAGFGSQHDVLHTVSCLPEIFNTYTEFLQQSFPFDSYSQVFVDLAYEESSAFSSMGIFSGDVIHPDTVIDATFATSQRMAECIARVWVGHVLTVRSLADYWIVEGLVGYLVALFVEKAFGRNERRFQRHQMTENVVNSSLHPSALPLSSEQFGDRSELHNEFFRHKSTVVMHMLADTIGENIFRDIIRHLFEESTCFTSGTLSKASEPVAPEAAASAPATATPGDKSSSASAKKYLNTKRLLKLARHRSALNLDDFRDRWINGSVCPVIKVVAEFERKKSACRVRVEQPVSRQMHGTLKVYIHETDEQVYEHESRIDDFRQVFNFACHSKVRKNRKRFFKPGESESAFSPTMSVDDPAGPSSPMPDNSLETDANPRELLDAPKKERKVKNDTPVLWIRVDPKMSWVRSLTVLQLPLWAHQELKQSPDVIAQLEACRSLGRSLHSVQGKSERDPAVSLMAFKSLLECLETSDYFHRVRVDAANQLAFASRPRRHTSSDRQLQGLIGFFKSRCYSQEHQLLVQPNDFSDFAEHFVVRGAIQALSTARDANNFSVQGAIDIIIELLESNDNSQNYYSDAFYISDLIRALSHLKPRSSEDRERIWKQVMRYLNYDRLLPSFRRVVTIACLEAISHIAFADLHHKKDSHQQDQALDPADNETVSAAVRFDFVQYCGVEHCYSIRVQAVHSLAFLSLKDPLLCTKLVKIIRRAETPTLRFRMAQAWREVFISHCSLNKNGYRKHLEAYASGEPARTAMDQLWSLLTAPQTNADSRLQHCLYLVYEGAFGHATPRCSASPQQQSVWDREFLGGKKLLRYPNARRRQRSKDKEALAKPKLKRPVKRPRAGSEDSTPSIAGARPKKPSTLAKFKKPSLKGGAASKDSTATAADEQKLHIQEEMKGEPI